MAEEKTGEGWNQRPSDSRAVAPSERPMPSFLRDRVLRRPPVEFTEERQHKFLQELARTGLRGHSADVAGVTADTVRRLEEKDPEFKALAVEAKDFFVDGLEAEAIRRATEGYLEPVFSQKTGEQIGVVRKFSDRLLEVLLRAGRPDKFRDNVQHEHKHSGGVLVVPAQALTDQSWEEQHGKAASGQEAIPAPALPFKED